MAKTAAERKRRERQRKKEQQEQEAKEAREKQVRKNVLNRGYRQLETTRKKEAEERMQRLEMENQALRAVVAFGEKGLNATENISQQGTDVTQRGLEGVESVVAETFGAFERTLASQEGLSNGSASGTHQSALSSSESAAFDPPAAPSTKHPIVTPSKVSDLYRERD